MRQGQSGFNNFSYTFVFVFAGIKTLQDSSIDE